LKPPDESADQRSGNNANTFDQTELCDAKTLPNCFECNGCRSAAMAARDASRVRVGHGHPASPSPRPAASAARWPASSTRPAFAALQRPGYVQQHIADPIVNKEERPPADPCGAGRSSNGLVSRRNERCAIQSGAEGHVRTPIAAGMPPKVALIALARKLLIILNAMVTDQTDWNHTAT